MAYKMPDLENYAKIKTIDHLSKIYRRKTNFMLLAIPLAGIAVYVLVLRRLLPGGQSPWYLQLAVGVVLYPPNCVLHELLHGCTYRLFCPEAKVKYRFGVLGSSTHIDGGYLRKWPFFVVCAGTDDSIEPCISALGNRLPVVFCGILLYLCDPVYQRIQRHAAGIPAIWP